MAAIYTSRLIAFFVYFYFNFLLAFNCLLGDSCTDTSGGKLDIAKVVISSRRLVQLRIKKRKIIIVIRVKVIIIMIMLRGRKAVECNNKSWRHICGCFSQKRKVAIFLLIVIVIIIIIMMITNINGSSS